MDIVIFGCGAMGKYLLTGLRAAGVSPVAFAVDVRPSPREVDGLGVLPIEKAVKAFPDALYVIAVFNGSAVLERVRRMGVNVTTFAQIARVYYGALLPFGALDRNNDMPEETAELFADAVSRLEYWGQSLWRDIFDPSFLPPYCDPAEIYFPPDLFTLGQEETFIDCGAYDGDTVREFYKRAGGEVLAVEPDPENYKRLIANFPNIHAFQLAIGLSNERVQFDTGRGVSGEVGKGADWVECNTLDNLLTALWVVPTYIKMDVEGAEMDALKGAALMIKRHKPILAICLYHKPNDIWQIPAYLHELVPEYRLYLRRYAEDCWEEVLYCVPPERVKK
jgi:FkbM family methyltransferase